MALLGAVDFESGGVDATADPDLGTLAGYVVAFGLHGVPFSIVISLLVLVSWTLSCLGGMWLLPLLPDTALAYAGGAVLALASASLSVPVAARLVRPMRGLFVTHTAIHNASLVGQSCKVLTQTVDEKLGRAEVAQRGSNLNIRVWAPTPNTLTRGATARIVAYEDKSARYRIEAES
ncbi:MAG: ubiquinone biosynthesis protein [Ramlibacter sp.]